jgi:hypothetical protein
MFPVSFGLARSTGCLDVSVNIADMILPYQHCELLPNQYLLLNNPWIQKEEPLLDSILE